MAGNCIVDDEACREASRNEIIRRYFKALCDHKTGKNVDSEIFKLELLLNQAGLAVGDRAVEKQAHAAAERTGGAPAAAIELPDGTVVTGKNGPLLGAASSALLNALKKLAGIDHEIDLVSARAIEPIQTVNGEVPGLQQSPAPLRRRCSSPWPLPPTPTPRPPRPCGRWLS